MKEVYSQKHKKFNRLDAIERGKIAAYLEQGLSKSKIACELSRSKSTIFYEIRKGTYKGRYQPRATQNHYASNNGTCA